MIDKSLANDVLTAALSTGGDFAELFIENKTITGLSMINGVLEKSLSGLNYGIGIRIFNKFNSVYAYTNDFSKNNLISVAKSAAAAINNAERVSVLNFNNTVIENKHLIKISPVEIDKKIVVDFLKEASTSAYEYSNFITETSCNYSASVQDVLIINSEGLWVTDNRTRTRVAISAVAGKENEKQTGGQRPGALKGFEFYESIDPKELGKESARMAVTMLNADFCPSGKMPVVIDNRFGGVIFHEACGHSLEATSVAKGASVFTDKLGQKIASDIVTAVDDGTLSNDWGSENIDDEGTKTQKNILIENGILKSYLVDKLNGRKMKMPSTGSGRRESYKFAPTSRMSNTYIGSGNSSTEEIIKNTEYGLFAKEMGGGSVQPATGEFNFAVQEGYMIRNGKIAEPVRGATLIGKGSEVLMQIDMVGNNLDHAQGMCGSISGSIPTNVGQPTIRVKEITVGGRSSN